MSKDEPTTPDNGVDLARRRETALRDVLALISRSREDEAPVFDLILRKSAELCGAHAAALALGQKGDAYQTMAASYEVSPATIALYDTGQVSMNPDISLAAKAILTGKIVHVRDMEDTDGYRKGVSHFVSVVRDTGIRTNLFVPLMTRTGGIGALILFRKEVRPYTADEIALVEGFAAQAVIAIENAQQFRALQDRLEREAASAEILEVISRSRDDDRPVFDLIAEHAAHLCRAAVCTFWRVADGMIHYCASHGLEGEGLAEAEGSPPAPLADNTLTGKVFKARAVARIEDATEESYADHQWVRARGLKQLIGVPIFVGDEVWGCISLMWPADGAPNEADIQLVQSFAAQAAIAIENVRQFRAVQTANAELQTRLAREAATREILEVISQSRDDDRPVFDAILQNATRLCAGDSAALLLGTPQGPHLTLAALWDGGDLPREALDAFIAEINRMPMPMDPALHISARAICSAAVVHIDDLAQSEGYLSGEASFRFMVEDQGVRTTLSVPIFSTDGPIGCISVHRNVVRPYSDDEIALIQSFAAQAVIATENVRQFRELQSRLAREAATRQVLEVISRSRDDDAPVFDILVRRAQDLCDAPISALILVEPDKQVLTLAAHVGYSDNAVALFRSGAMRLEANHSYAAKAIIERKMVNLSDLTQSDLYKSGSPIVRTMADEVGIRSVMFVPLISGEEAIGNFSLLRFDKRPFTDTHIALVETFAAQAVIAIENVRQFRALEALNAELGDRVKEQVGEIERMGRLKRFLPSAVADAVVSSGSERMLKSHRALLGVLFCDIRGFTAFCETAEPEETIEVLQTYHEEMGRLIEAHGAGVDHRMGDGIMVLFNDPLPCDDPAGCAVRLAMAMRARMAELCRGWKKMGYRLGFGLGVSLGYATVGMVGSGGRFDYTASGTAINLASRLCDEAQDGDILVSPRARTAIEDDFNVESRGEITFKGIREPVEVFCVTGARSG